MSTPLFREAAFVDGEWIPAERAPLVVTNPCDGSEMGAVPELDREQIRRAISAAQRAFAPFSRLPAAERALLLQKIAQAIETRCEELAHLLTREQGKPLKESRAELRYGAAYFHWFAEEAVRIEGEIIEPSAADQRMLVFREPIGPAAAITPWNFPHAMIARKMAAALAAGCTFIVKPAPETPFSALALAALAEEAGAPAGVVQVLTGDAVRIGSALLEAPEIRKLSFTGSTEVGKLLMRGSADTMKRLTLELGGNAPFIVFDDADLDLALRDSLFGKFRNAGQTCICVNRFIVHRSLADRFAAGLTELSKNLVVGPGEDERSDIGPLINREGRNKVARLLEDALAGGAVLRCGEPKPDEGSLFMRPAVITGLTPKMALWREEIFGPLAAIAEFDSEDEAIALANDSVHGLAAYFYTGALSRAFRVARRLEYGMIGINGTLISYPQAPFGGVKQSGFGREGSRHGIQDYLNLKYVLMSNIEGDGPTASRP